MEIISQNHIIRLQGVITLHSDDKLNRKYSETVFVLVLEHFTQIRPLKTLKLHQSELVSRISHLDANCNELCFSEAEKRICKSYWSSFKCPMFFLTFVYSKKGTNVTLSCSGLQSYVAAGTILDDSLNLLTA